MNTYDLKKLLEATKKQTAKDILELLNKYDYDIAIEAIRKTYLGDERSD